MTTSHPSDTPPVGQIPPELRRQLLSWLLADPQQAARMTYDEFLEWADEDTLAEWVDGRVVMASPASARHQLLANFLVAVLHTFAQLYSLGVVLDGPFQMKLSSSGREPDVLFLAQDHLDRLKRTYLDGPADLVVEIISPESIGRDRGDKFYEYQRAGIPEYWLIDPDTERAEFYQLDARGAYQLMPLDAAGAYHAQVLPGFWINVEWLWRANLPATEVVLLAVAGDAYERYLRQLMDQRGQPIEPPQP
jgi:Uma2 family endonuclease